MIRKLLIVSASALVLAVISLSLAWMVGGRQFVKDVEQNDGFSLNFDGDGIEPKTKRTLAFDPAVPLTIDAPVELTFTRGATPGMTVEGPEKLVRAMRWEGGRLFLAKGVHVSHGSLDITITAPQLPKLTIEGPGQIELNDVRQPVLAIAIEGAGNVEGEGKVDSLSIEAGGAGNLDLEHLEARHANVGIAGFGNVDLNVSGRLDAKIAGAGNVTLHRKPQVVNTQISGIGQIDHDY